MKTLSKQDIAAIGDALGKIDLDMEVARGVLKFLKDNNTEIADARTALAAALLFAHRVTSWADLTAQLDQAD